MSSLPARSLRLWPQVYIPTRGLREDATKHSFEEHVVDNPSFVLLDALERELFAVEGQPMKLSDGDEVAEKHAEKQLLLLSGPAGSGKSTFMCACNTSRTSTVPGCLLAS